MIETAWAHLPNAAVIDEMLADATNRPDVWRAARREIESTVWSCAWDGARHAIDCVARSAAWSGVRDAAWDRGVTTARASVRAAVLALTAWDSSADLLALTPDALRTIIDTCDGDVKHQAVLLLPAVIARSASNGSV